MIPGALVPLPDSFPVSRAIAAGLLVGVGSSMAMAARLATVSAATRASPLGVWCTPAHSWLLDWLPGLLVPSSVVRPTRLWV
eukprot:jgi/Tetstr1/432073/TSEL_021544.t1